MKCGFHLLKKMDCWFWIDWFWTYATSYFQWGRSIQNYLKCFFDDSNDNKATTFQESFELIQSTIFLLNSMMLRSVAYPIVINFNGRSFSYLAKSSFWSCLLLTILFQASCFIIIFIKLLRFIFSCLYDSRNSCISVVSYRKRFQILGSFLNVSLNWT